MTIILEVSRDLQDGRTREWAIIELQGDLKPLGECETFRECVGNLYYNKYGQPTLVIGHHILAGREEILEKPFAVIEKSKSNDGDNLLLNASVTSDITMLDDTQQTTILDKTVALENKTKYRTQYVVQAVCSKKLIFKGRPKPIIKQ